MRDVLNLEDVLRLDEAESFFGRLEVVESLTHVALEAQELTV